MILLTTGGERAIDKLHYYQHSLTNTQLMQSSK